MSSAPGRDGPAYAWAGEWLDADDALTMSHTSVATTRDGLVVSGAATEATLVFRDASGTVVRRIPVPGIVELHGLTLVEEDGEERLWVADTATKLYGGSRDLDIRKAPGGGQVVQIDLDGATLRTLERPPLPVYADTGYSPTAVAVDEARFGGSGDIWVADGYGAKVVHRFAADGAYLATLTGEEGGGRFDEPHDVLIDRRGPRPELYVADRRNSWLQVYDLDGTFLRVVGEGALVAPTQLALAGDALLVTDLLAGRLTMLDRDDAFVGHLFAQPAPPSSWEAVHDGWPNARGDDGLIVPMELTPGEFHTPHGIASGPDGTVYVSEFAIGGRIAVLRPQ